MASIQPGKLKLSNYKYELNDQGELVEKAGGTQPYSAKVIDTIDFDWRPFTIDFSCPDETPESFGDNRISAISGESDMYSYSLYYTEDLIWLLRRGLTHSVAQSEESEHADYSGLAYYANLAYYSGLAYYANQSYYSSLAYYANHAYYSSLAYYANSAYTLEEIRYKNSSLTDGQKYSVSYVDKSTTENGTSYVTICYTDLSSTANTGTEKTAVTLTNTTKYKVVDGIAQDSQGRLSYTYLEINTTHTNTSKGTAQGQVINNVHLDANGNFSYTTYDPSITTGIVNSTPGVSTTGGKTIPGTLATAYNILTGILEDSNGKIAYTYTPLYMIPSHFTYHVLSLDTTNVPNTTNAGTTTTVKVINGLALSENGNNKESHEITYHTISVPTKHYVDSLLKANDTFRYCGTFIKGTGDTITLQPAITNTTTDPETGLPINENWDTSKGAVYKFTGSRVEINGVKLEAGDSIYSYTDNASATTLVGWNVIQQNINITNLTPSLARNSEATNRLLTNIHITNGGELSYNYTDGYLEGNFTLSADTYTYNTAYICETTSGNAVHTYFNKTASFTNVNTIINNDLKVTGKTYFSDLAYINDIRLYTDNVTQIGNTLTVSGSTELQSNLIVKGDTYTYANTYLGNAGTDRIYMQGNTYIGIANTIHNIKLISNDVQFENLSALWGTATLS